MTFIAGMLMVMLGGATGAMLRFLTQEAGKRWTSLPGWTSIFAVNVVGSFCIGLSFGWITAIGAADAGDLHLSNLQHFQDAETISLALGGFVTGLCGGFTTFSTFSLDNIFLLYTRRWQLVFNIVMSVILATLAAWGGLELGGTFA